MAEVAEGGGAAPLPPKRPTIIRPGKTGDGEANGSTGQPLGPSMPAPARPAPPPPGSGPGRPPPVGGRPLPTPGPAAGHPPPPVPSKPASSEGPPALPQRNSGPIGTPPPPQRSTSLADRKLANRNSVHGGEKKRLEITVVSARPMSEVGFRDTAPPVKPELPAPPAKPSPPEAQPSLQASKPPRPASVSRPPPPSPSLRPTPAGKPPPVPSPRSSTSQAPSEAEAVTPRLPPPHSLPPPVPASRSRSSSQEHSENLLDFSPVYAEPDENVEAKSTHAPPPALRPPPLPASTPKSSDARDGEEEGDGGTDVPSAKPKRPTIIRPGRPQRPSAISNKTGSSEAPAQEPPGLPGTRKNSASAATEKDAEVKDSSHRLPFKTKLRPTVLAHPSGETTTSSTDTGSASGPAHVLVNDEVEYAVISKPMKEGRTAPVQREEEVLAMPGEGEPPPLPPPLKPCRAPKNDKPSSAPPPLKPKPALKPKPSVPSKPKPAVEAPSNQDGGLLLGVTGHIKEPEEDNRTDGLEMPPPRLPPKRPTIIRKAPKTDSESQGGENKSTDSMLPPKAGQGSSEEGDEETKQGKVAGPAPPRRPISFIGLRKTSQPDVSRCTGGDDQPADAATERSDNSDLPPHPAMGRPLPARQKPPRPSSVIGVMLPPAPSAVKMEKPPVPASSPASAGEESKTKQASPLPARPVRGAVPIPGQRTDSQEEPVMRSRPPRPTGRPKSVAVFPPTDSRQEEKGAPSSRAAQLVGELQGGAGDTSAMKGEGPPRPEKTPGRPPAPLKASHSLKMTKNPPSRPVGRKTEAKATPERVPLPPRPGPSHPLYQYTLCHPHAIVQHDFAASEPGELPLKTGEVVLLESRSNPEWLVGRTGHEKGLFPENFVEIIHPLHDEVNMMVEDEQAALPSSSPYPPGRHRIEVSSGPRCEARFDFEGGGSGDLSFEEGDVIRLLERVGAEWLRGELAGAKGIFPSSFVEIIEDLPAAPSDGGRAAAEMGNFVTAIFDFDGLQDELSFQAGQRVEVLGKISEDWLMGRLDGHEGKLPTTFIDHLPPNLPSISTTTTTMPPKSYGAPTLSSSDAPSLSSGVSARQPGADRQGQSSRPVLAKAVALFDFHGDQEGDLSFKEGEMISILEYVDAEWLRGQVGSQQGMFPRGFVNLDHTHTAPTPSDTPPAAPASRSHARALYDFVGQDSTELSFKEGDIITLGDFPPGTTEWRQGEIHGQSGLFPVAFVENID